MKNEFMINWDGLRTNNTERVIVLAATNRPFDLDEAVIRRLPRRWVLYCALISPSYYFVIWGMFKFCNICTAD